MEAPVHYKEDNKESMRTRLVALGAGIALIALVAVGLTMSGYWSPPAGTAKVDTASTAP